MPKQGLFGPAQNEVHHQSTAAERETTALVVVRFLAKPKHFEPGSDLITCSS